MDRDDGILDILRRQEALLERILRLYEKQNDRLGDLLGVLCGHIKSTDEISKVQIKSTDEISKGHIKSTDEIALILKEHGESIDRLRMDTNILTRNLTNVKTGELHLRRIGR